MPEARKEKEACRHSDIESSRISTARNTVPERWLGSEMRRHANTVANSRGPGSASHFFTVRVVGSITP